MKSILAEEAKSVEYEGTQYDESPPGIYINPDDDSGLPWGERIYLPFSGKDLTKEALESALRTNGNFINYALEECGINILTPKGNQLYFRPYVPNDSVRHREALDANFPQESRYSLELKGPIPPSVILPIIAKNNTKGLPLKEIEAAFAKQ